MSDGTQLSLGAGGDLLFNKDSGSSKTAVTLIAVSTSSPYTTLASAANPVPAQISIGGAVASTTNPHSIAEVPIAGTAYAPGWSPNAAAVSGTAKASAGNLRSVTVVNRNAAIRYFQVWDNATTQTGTLLLQIPLDGATAPATTSKAVGADILGPQGIAVANGITWGFSTTNTTYSAATAADHDAFIAYK